MLLSANLESLHQASAAFAKLTTRAMRAYTYNMSAATAVPLPHPIASLCNNSALRRAARRVSQLYDSILAPTELKTSQFAILHLIDRTGPAALTELAQEMGMDRSTLGHNLRPLERDGLLELLVDPRDRRSRRIALTRLGQDKLLAARALWTKAQAQFEATFGAERAAELRTTLQELASDTFADTFTRAQQPA